MARSSRQQVVIAVFSAMMGAAVVGAIWLISDSGGGSSPSGKVRLSFDPAPDDAAGKLRRSGAFEDAVATANRELRLPVDVQVKVVDEANAEKAGVEGPAYLPADRTIYFPWSFEEQSRQELKALPQFQALSARERRRTLVDAMTFVLYHELAHGLINVLDVPVVASPEVVADDFAGIFAIASSHGKVEVPLSIAELQQADAKDQDIPTVSQFADEHGFSRQRAINALCQVYGSDPKRFADLVGADRLPESRAGSCEIEYRDDLRDWRRLLDRWLTKTGGLRPLPRGG